MSKPETLFYFVAHQLSSHVWVYAHDGEAHVCYTRRLDLVDFFLAEPEREARLLSFAQPEGPALIQVNKDMLYGLVQTQTQRILAGPVRMTGGYDLRCRLSWNEMPASYPYELSACPLAQFAELMLLLHDFLNEDQLTLHECLMDNSTLRQSGEERKIELQRQVDVNLEETKKHNP